MITEIRFFFWRIAFTYVYVRRVFGSNLKEGWQYSKYMRDYFYEDFSPEASLREDMTYWDG